MVKAAFRDCLDDLPDWRDGGDVEMLREDGSTIRAKLLIDELFTGEDDIPLQVLILPDGSEPSFHDFKGWRHIRDGNEETGTN